MGRTFLRRVLLVAVIGSCAASCQKFDLRGDGYNDGTADWTGKMRTPTSKGQISGLDGRAQEIERNLGVR